MGMCDQTDTIVMCDDICAVLLHCSTPLPFDILFLVSPLSAYTAYDHVFKYVYIYIDIGV